MFVRPDLQELDYRFDDERKLQDQAAAGTAERSGRQKLARAARFRRRGSRAGAFNGAHRRRHKRTLV